MLLKMKKICKIVYQQPSETGKNIDGLIKKWNHRQKLIGQNIIYSKKQSFSTKEYLSQCQLTSRIRLIGSFQRSRCLKKTQLYLKLHWINIAEVEKLILFFTSFHTDIGHSQTTVSKKKKRNVYTDKSLYQTKKNYPVPFTVLVRSLILTIVNQWRIEGY